MMNNYKKYLLILMAINVLGTSACAKKSDTNEIKVLKSLDYSFDTDIKFVNEDYYLNNQIFTSDKENISYKFDGNIDEIIEDIEYNSKVYAAANNLKSFFEDKNDAKLIKKYLRNILKNLKENSSNIDKDIFYIKNIIIINQSSSLDFDDSNVYLSIFKITNYDYTENILSIDKNRIKSINVFDNRNYEDRLQAIISYGINIARYKSSEEKDNNINTLAVGSLMSSTYYDRKNRFDESTFERLNYKEIEDEGELLCLALLNNDKDTPKKYYDAILNSDFKELYNIFKLNSVKDISNFRKIIGAMDSKNMRNDYVLRYGCIDDIKHIKKYVGYEYKLLIHNMFVNQMMDYMKREDISLTDNLTLYNLMLSVLLDDIYVNGHNNLKEYDSNFVQKMECSINKYFDYLMNYYNASEEDINDAMYYADGMIEDISTSLTYREPSYNSKRFLSKYPMVKIVVTSADINLNARKEMEKDNQLILKK